MKNNIILYLLFLISISFISCVSKEIPQPVLEPKEVIKKSEISTSLSWEEEWQETLVKARKEGKVVIYSTTGGETRDALVSKFKERTGIVAEFLVGSGAEISQKIQMERRSGLHVPDLYIGGATTIFNVLKPSGILEPVEPLLILPDVKDPNTWWQKRLPFTDVERKLVFSFMAAPSTGGTVINTNRVKLEDIISYKDLLAPRWKGNIILNDPTVAGKGLRWFGVALTMGYLNLDYMKALAKQEPVITRDRRMQAEWLARGKYPIAIATVDAIVVELVRAGAPVQFINLVEDKPWLSAGGSNLAVISKSTHPYAARVFTNWLLGKEGQAIFARYYDSLSARDDVPAEHLREEEKRKPDMNYFNGEAEEFLLQQEEHARTAREIFGHLMK